MEIKFPLTITSWDKAEYDALLRVVNSGMFTMGREVRGFENEFSTFLGTRFAVMVNSGSSANLLMTASLFYTNNPALRLKRGDEVVVPAISWSTTFFPLYQYGLKLKFVDVDLETLNYSISSLKTAITDKTRLIVLVTLLGNPNDYKGIYEIIDGKNITLIEDNCEGMGATFNGKATGTFGVMGSFSTFFSHHISTMEGGIVVTDDEELYHIMLSLRAHGWTRDLPDHNHVVGPKSDDPFAESFRFVLPGYNVRPLELSGALGREQLKKLPKLLEGRRKNGALVQKKLSDHPRFRIQREIGESSWFGFSLILREQNAGRRAELIKDLNIAGFELRPIVSGDFTKNPVMRYIEHEIHQTLTNAEYISANGLFIGNPHHPMDDAIDVLVTL